MSARPDTWMPMFWGDYARDTGHLDNAHHGAYLMLIKHYWCTGGSLPDDDDDLWRIACCNSKAAWRAVRRKIEPFFMIADGLWHHKRIDHELENAKAISEARRAAGQRGGKAAKGKSGRKPKEEYQKNSNANSRAIREPIANGIAKNTQSPSPSSSLRSEESPLAIARGERDPPKRPLALDDEMLDWCGENTPSINPFNELQAFNDWKKANGRRFKDDRAAFRNWCRKARQFGPISNRANGQGGWSQAFDDAAKFLGLEDDCGKPPDTFPAP